jgi:hypothetical protein
MRPRLPVVKLIGVTLFVVGSIVLGFSIIGLVPGEQPMQAGATMFTYLMVNVIQLFVAAFMVAAGMFFYIFAGDWSGSPRTRHRQW